MGVSGGNRVSVPRRHPVAIASIKEQLSFGRFILKGHGGHDAGSGPRRLRSEPGRPDRRLFPGTRRPANRRLPPRRGRRFRSAITPPPASIFTISGRASSVGNGWATARSFVFCTISIWSRRSTRCATAASKQSSAGRSRPAWAFHCADTTAVAYHSRAQPSRTEEPKTYIRAQAATTSRADFPAANWRHATGPAGAAAPGAAGDIRIRTSKVRLELGQIGPNFC